MSWRMVGFYTDADAKVKFGKCRNGMKRKGWTRSGINNL